MNNQKPCAHCGESPTHNPQCIVAVAQRGGSVLPFVGVGKVVMRGVEFIARAKSRTMALRIANALNQYQPNRSGS